MLREWEKRNPGRVESIFRALSNVTPSHLLDRQLFDFSAVAASGVAVAAVDGAAEEDFASFATIPVATIQTAY